MMHNPGKFQDYLVRIAASTKVSPIERESMTKSKESATISPDYSTRVPPTNSATFSKAKLPEPRNLNSKPSARRIKSILTPKKESQLSNIFLGRNESATSLINSYNMLQTTMR